MNSEFDLIGKEKVKSFPSTTNSSPSVSICIPCYNHAAYISKCLESVLNQETDFEYEILLGEDDSSDETREICIDYATKYPEKIRLFLHDRSNVIKINGAPTGRFNFLYSISKAKGHYIALCDGDDYWTDPYKLQKQFDFLEKNRDYSLVHHPVQYVNDKGKAINQKRKIFPLNSTEDLAKFNSIMTCSVLFRSDLLTLPKWFASILMGDWVIWLLLSQKGKIHKMEESMACYRIHQGGIWSSMSYEKGLKAKIDNVNRLDRNLGFKYHREFQENIKYLYYQAYISAKTNKHRFLTIKFFFICLLNLNNSFYNLRDLLYIIRH